MSLHRRLEYYRAATRFWLSASELQRTRCLSASPDSDAARADLNFYVVAVEHIREVARMAADRAQVPDARSGLQAFDTQWPRFKELRDLEEHTTGIGSAQTPYGIWYFSGVVADLRPDGSVEFIVRAQETQESVRKLAAATEEALSTALALKPSD